MKHVLVLLLAAATIATAQDSQKLRLPNSATDRFDVMDYINPPAEFGEAHVCLWEGDKEAAFTFTVDDAWVANVNFWVGAAESVDVPVTIFATTHRWDGTAYAPFPEIERLYNAGHAIQSHSAYHNNIALHDSGLVNLWDEYRGSKDSIESAMPYNPCYTLAYPGGAWPNDPDSAALAGYNAARSTVAKPNLPARIYYMSTRSHSGWATAVEALRVALGDTAIDLSKYRDARYGWSSSHMHMAQDQVETLNKLRLLKTYEDRTWLAHYPDLIRYAQERDSHTLTVDDVGANDVYFTVTDSMHDSVFTYPLTVKVKVDGSWDTVIATQNGNAMDASLKTDSTGTYALVSAVPDQGQVHVWNGSDNGGTGYTPGDINVVKIIRTREYEPFDYYETSTDTILFAVDMGYIHRAVREWGSAFCPVGGCDGSSDTTYTLGPRADSVLNAHLFYALPYELNGTAGDTAANAPRDERSLRIETRDSVFTAGWTLFHTDADTLYDTLNTLWDMIDSAIVRGSGYVSISDNGVIPVPQGAVAVRAGYYTLQGRWMRALPTKPGVYLMQRRDGSLTKLLVK